MRESFKHLNKTDRLQIEVLLRAKLKPLEIAKIIGVHNTTIYRELKRGKYIHTEYFKDKESYSSDLAEQKYQNNLRAKGAGLKIGNDIKLANFIEQKIIKENYSPEAVLLEIKSKSLKFKVQISKSTLYSYIDKKVFLNITNKNLPIKRNRCRRNKKIMVQKQSSRGESIEKRPEKILTREEFGHWEMDTVIGKKGESEHSLLAITERKTRYEILILLNQNNSDSIVKAINKLEQKWNNLFPEIFKTITVDNGKEFSNCIGIENSIFNNAKRTKLYYCHPYSSFERGSNENNNRLIRRFIPKGSNFDNLSKQDIQKIENWINNYPRKLFDGESAKNKFDEEIKILKIKN